MLKINPDAGTKRFLREVLPLWFNFEWPEWIDGFFACLNPLVDYHFNLSEKIIPALAAKFSIRGRRIIDCCEGQSGYDSLCLNAQTNAAYQKMAEVQTGNFWVIPMSLANGKRYPGRTCSPRRYLELAGQGEFGVGPLEGLCATLTHFNERVQPGKFFRMDFAGAEYYYPGFSECVVTYLSWDSDGDASFGSNRPSNYDLGSASVLGYLPRPLTFALKF